MPNPHSVHKRKRVAGAALAIGFTGLLTPTFARAHFILDAPASWMSQDPAGAPEKMGPCGDEGGGTASGTVTPFHPGDTITVTIREVVPHPGHYRVALAVNSRSELVSLGEPGVTPTPSDACASSAIETPPVFPVLADGLLVHTQAFSGAQTVQVTLPKNVTCTKCTLQVLEFMSSHGAPCFYHHCADISILPADAGGNTSGSGNGGADASVDAAASSGSSISGGSTGTSGASGASGSMGSSGSPGSSASSGTIASGVTTGSSAGSGSSASSGSNGSSASTGAARTGNAGGSVGDASVSGPNVSGAGDGGSGGGGCAVSGRAAFSVLYLVPLASLAAWLGRRRRRPAGNRQRAGTRHRPPEN